jgi:hypothetical protein
MNCVNEFADDDDIAINWIHESTIGGTCEWLCSGCSGCGCGSGGGGSGGWCHRWTMNILRLITSEYGLIEIKTSWTVHACETLINCAHKFTNNEDAAISRIHEPTVSSTLE